MSEERQFVAFMLGDEEYAVEILAVKEIIRWTQTTRVPKAPSYVKGVINLRGTVIPVIDSHIRFNLGEQVATDSSRIIVFKHEEAIIGMTVDIVTEVLSLDTEEIEQPQTARAVDSGFISGIGKIKDRLLIILDLSRVLDLGIQQKERMG